MLNRCVVSCLDRAGLPCRSVVPSSDPGYRVMLCWFGPMKGMDRVILELGYQCASSRPDEHGPFGHLNIGGHKRKKAEVSLGSVLRNKNTTRDHLSDGPKGTGACCGHQEKGRRRL